MRCFQGFGQSSCRPLCKPCAHIFQVAALWPTRSLRGEVLAPLDAPVCRHMVVLVACVVRSEMLTSLKRLARAMLWGLSGIGSRSFAPTTKCAQAQNESWSHKILIAMLAVALAPGCGCRSLADWSFCLKRVQQCAPSWTAASPEPTQFVLQPSSPFLNTVFHVPLGKQCGYLHFESFVGKTSQAREHRLLLAGSR